jgi:hypothetical protein
LTGAGRVATCCSRCNARFDYHDVLVAGYLGSTRSVVALAAVLVIAWLEDPVPYFL